MTKDASFKRAVRERARRTGEKYTAARAAMEGEGLRQRIARPVDPAGLKRHLEVLYDIEVSVVSAIDDHHPATTDCRTQ